MNTISLILITTIHLVIVLALYGLLVFGAAFFRKKGTADMADSRDLYFYAKSITFTEYHKDLLEVEKKYRKQLTIYTTIVLVVFAMVVAHYLYHLEKIVK